MFCKGGDSCTPYRYCNIDCNPLILFTFWGAVDSPDPDETLEELQLMPKAAKKKKVVKKKAKKAKKKK
jgi:hypothetical protein